MDYLLSLISQYSPFSSLLQYVFHRILGKYIKNDLSMSNFAMGTCLLKNLDLSSEKINASILKDSPLSLYKGSIGKFNLKIPWTKILQESIEITIDDFDLWLFVKDSGFEKATENKEIMNEPIEEEEEEKEEKELYDTKVDVFKRIVNKILLNMTVDIKKIRVRVFESESDMLRYMKGVKDFEEKKDNKANNLNSKSFETNKNNNNNNNAQKLENNININDSYIMNSIRNDNNADHNFSQYHPSPENKRNINYNNNTNDNQNNSCLLLRLASFSIRKRKDQPIDLQKSALFLEEIENFYLELHECSANILSSFSQESPSFFGNILNPNLDSFHYPNISHPSTILILPKGISLHIQKRKISEDMVKLGLKLENMELTIDPEQMKLLMCLAIKITKELTKIAEKEQENQELSDAPLLQRNRSHSVSKEDKTKKRVKKDSIDSIPLEKKSIVIKEPMNKEKQHKTQISQLKESVIYQSISKKPPFDKENPLSQSISRKRPSESKDILKGLIKDYFQKEEASLSKEYSIELFEPNVLSTLKSPVINKEESSIKESSLMLKKDQTELLFIPSPQKPAEKSFNNAKIELNISRIHINLLKSSFNPTDTEIFSRVWLFSNDPLFQSASLLHSKYNLNFPIGSFQLMVLGLGFNGKVSRLSQLKIKKIRLIEVQDQDIKDIGLDDDSELFQSAYGSLTLSLLYPKRIEKKLKVHVRKKTENSIIIKELLRIDYQRKKPLQSTKKIKGVYINILRIPSLYKENNSLNNDQNKGKCNIVYNNPYNITASTNENLNIGLDKIINPITEQQAKPCYSIRMALNQASNTINIISNPIFLSIDLQNLKDLMQILSILSFNTSNPESNNLNTSISINELNNSLVFSKHHRQKPLTNPPDITFQCPEISLDFERTLSLVFKGIVTGGNRLLGTYKASFESFNLDYYSNSNKDFDLIELKNDDINKILTCEGDIIERNSIFFQIEDNAYNKGIINNDKTQNNTQNTDNKLNFDTMKTQDYENLLRKKPLFGIFLRKLHINAYYTIIKDLYEFIAIITPKITTIFGERQSDPFQCGFSLVISEISLYLNENDQKLPFLIQLSGLQTLMVMDPLFNSIYFSLEEVFIHDGEQKAIKLDCPLKLVEGVSSIDIQKTLKGRYQEKLKDLKGVERVLLYKQGVFLGSHTSNKRKKEFFKDFDLLESRSGVMKVFYSEKINKEIEIKVTIKGLVLKPDLSIYEIEKRVKKLIETLNLNKDNENKEEKPEKNSNPLVNLSLSIELRSICIDIYPYYCQSDILSSPDLFNLKPSDLDPEKQGYFYSNTRSVLLLDGITLKFVNNTINNSLEKNLESFELKKLKFCLLQYFDFQPEANPLLLSDFETDLSQYYDSILEKIGFMPIFEMADLRLVKVYDNIGDNTGFNDNNRKIIDYQDKFLQFTDDNYNILTKSNHNDIINEKNVKVKPLIELQTNNKLANISKKDDFAYYRCTIEVFSLDLCKDSIQILPKHLNLVLLDLTRDNPQNDLDSQQKVFPSKNPNDNNKKNDSSKKCDSFIVIDEEELLEEEKKETEAFNQINSFKASCCKRNSGNQRLRLRICSFIVKLYDGLDFDFTSQHIFPLNSDQKEKEVVEPVDPCKETLFMNDYFSGLNKNKTTLIKKNKGFAQLRTRLKSRCLNSFVSLVAENLRLSFQSLKAWNYELRIGNFEVIDSINTSNLRKLVSMISNKCSLEENNDFLVLRILGKEKEKKIFEISFLMKIESLNIFLNGANLEFLLGFFLNETSRETENLMMINEYFDQNSQINSFSKQNNNYKVSSNNDKKETQFNKNNQNLLFQDDFITEETQNLQKKTKYDYLMSPIPNNNIKNENIDYFTSLPNRFSNDIHEDYLNSDQIEENADKLRLNLLDIEEFQIYFDYDASYTHLNKVLENSFNLINIGNINNLKLNFKQVILRDESINSLLSEKIIGIWQKDIILNQKPAILKKLPYINNLFNLMEGFANIFYYPYIEAKKGGRIEKGIFKGLGSFTKAVSIEGLNLTDFIGKGLGFGLKKLGVEGNNRRGLFPNFIEKARGIIDPDENLKKKEKYRKN